MARTTAICSSRVEPTARRGWAEIIESRLQARSPVLACARPKSLGRLLWKGKVFYRDQRLLRNRIEDLAILAPITGGNTDGIEKLTVNGRDTFLLFPARLYCGQSLLDGRRESVIIDYAFTDELPGYRESPDALGGRNGVRIRDEIRMVRPGFYLGRAYLKGVFGLNFTLINRDADPRDVQTSAPAASRKTAGPAPRSPVAERCGSLSRHACHIRKH